MTNIIQIFEDILNTKVYAVGGCVRDHLMGLPSKDIDLACALSPDEILSRARYHRYLAYDVGGRKYGTVVVEVGDAPYEITTFRSDNDCDGRHCGVKFSTSLNEDLARRDFTINAMAMDSQGNIIDLFGGQWDIEHRIIRCVGLPSDRFKEDYLRIIRACRFAARFGFRFESGMLFVMRLLVDDILKHVAMERIKMEFDKAFADAEPSQFIRLLDFIGFLRVILPEIVLLKGLTQNPEHHPEGDAYAHTLDVIDSTPEQYRWAALLHDIGKAVTCEYDQLKHYNTFYGHDKAGVELVTKVAQRLKFSNDLADECIAVCEMHMRPIFMVKAGVTTSAIRRFIKDCGKHLDAIKAVVMADTWSRDNSRLMVFELMQSEIDNISVKPVLMGRHLITKGLQPGPEFGKILKQAFEIQMNTGETNPDTLFNSVVN